MRRLLWQARLPRRIVIANLRELATMRARRAQGDARCAARRPAGIDFAPNIG